MLRIKLKILLEFNYIFSFTIFLIYQDLFVLLHAEKNLCLLICRIKYEIFTERNVIFDSTYLPGAAGLALAKDNVVHDSVFGILVGGPPIEERGHIEAGIDARVLQMVHEKGQRSTTAPALDAR